MTALHDLATKLEDLAREVRAEADRVWSTIQSLASDPGAQPAATDLPSTVQADNPPDAVDPAPSPQDTEGSVP